MDTTGLCRDPIHPVWVPIVTSLLTICYMYFIAPGRGGSGNYLCTRHEGIQGKLRLVSFILNISSVRRWVVVSLMPSPVYPGTDWIEAGWDPETIRTISRKVKSLVRAGIWTCNFQPVVQSLYWLRYHQTMLSPSSHVYCSILTKVNGNAKNHTTTISFLYLKIKWKVPGKLLIMKKGQLSMIFHFFILFFIRAIFKLYIYIPTNCTQLIYFINTLKHKYCLKL